MARRDPVIIKGETLGRPGRYLVRYYATAGHSARGERSGRARRRRSFGLRHSRVPSLSILTLTAITR
jgi:hypothetical protein